MVKGGGDISSVSQKQGAVGGQMWDIITISDDTDGDDAGNIPDGSTVQVSVYKHEGQNQETKGQLVETKTFPVDTAKLGERPGSYSFQALMDGTYPAAGTYYWVERLIGPDGGVIAEGKYGDDTERTYVQEYDTDAAKAWLSTNDAEYADKTVNTFDVLTQKYYTQWGEDDQTGSSTSVYFGATAKGTQAQFSIWREGDGNADTDVKVLDGQTMDLPKIGDRKEPYSQKLKSETFTLPEGTVAGTHYYMLRVTNTAGRREPSGHRHPVRRSGVGVPESVWTARASRSCASPPLRRNPSSRPTCPMCRRPCMWTAPSARAAPIRWRRGPWAMTETPPKRSVRPSASRSTTT